MTYEELAVMNTYDIPMDVYDRDGNRWPIDIPIPMDAEVMQTLKDRVAWDVFIDAYPNDKKDEKLGHGKYPLENEKKVKYLIVEATSDYTIQPIMMLDSFEEATTYMKSYFLYYLGHILDISDTIDFRTSEDGFTVSACGEYDGGNASYRFYQILKNGHAICEWHIFDDVTENDYDIWASVIKLEV